MKSTLIPIVKGTAMRVVFKFPIGRHMLPRDAKVVKVAMRGSATMWILHDPEAPKVLRTFVVHGTGTGVPDNEVFIGTFFDAGFVWHLFEVT